MRLIPRDAKFFDLFAELSGNLTDGAKLLRSILADPRDLAMRVSQVQAIEHKGDKATHAIITKLNQSFITPFDREDIHRLRFLPRRRPRFCKLRGPASRDVQNRHAASGLR